MLVLVQCDTQQEHRGQDTASGQGNPAGQESPAAGNPATILSAPTVETGRRRRRRVSRGALPSWSVRAFSTWDPPTDLRSAQPAVAFGLVVLPYARQMNPDDERPVDLDGDESDLVAEPSTSEVVSAQELSVGDWATIDGRVAHLEAVRLEEDGVTVLTGRERVVLTYGTPVERFILRS